MSYDSQENTCPRVSFLIYAVLKLSKKVIFSVNGGIGDDTRWEDMYSDQSIKTLLKYQNKYHHIKSIITISKA